MLHRNTSSRRRSAALHCVWILAGGLAAERAWAQQSAAAQPVFVDGLAQVVEAFEDPSEWIQHDLWVETEFDTDLMPDLFQHWPYVAPENCA